MNSLKDIEREYKEANTTRWLAAEKECSSMPSAGLWALRIATHPCFCPCPREHIANTRGAARSCQQPGR